jgi:hypothetical protein
MSVILYYSNYCNHCKKILHEVSRSKVKDGIHFVCIDKRVKKNGATYVVLETQEILLPPNISRVPSALLLNRGNMVIEGDDVLNHIIEKTQQQHVVATQGNGEPCAFGLNDFGSIMSDNYSFLDQSPDEMLAKGTGGMRQIHNYVSVNDNFTIETPNENYKADTIGNNGMSLDQIRAMRDRDVPQPQRRM